VRNNCCFDRHLRQFALIEQHGPPRSSRKALLPLTEANHDILIRYSEANPLITLNGRPNRDTETLTPNNAILVDFEAPGVVSAW
jgi:hypothetical protein